MREATGVDRRRVSGAPCQAINSAKSFAQSSRSTDGGTAHEGKTDRERGSLIV